MEEWPVHDAARRRMRAWALAALAGVACLTVACSSEDVTGEPEDIGDLVHVMADGSSCSPDAGADEVAFHVRLRNTGEDERTVAVTPRLRDASGDERGDTLDAFEVTVPGYGEAEGDGLLEGAPDDLAGCFVQIDSGDDIRIARAPG